MHITQHFCSSNNFKEKFRGALIYNAMIIMMMVAYCRAKYLIERRYFAEIERKNLSVSNAKNKE